METSGIHRLIPMFIQAAEYTPGISTVSSIVRLALLALEQLRHDFKEMAGQVAHAYKIVSRSDITRQCILLIPILGNVTVAITDYIAYRKIEKARFLSLELEKKIKEIDKKQLNKIIASINLEDPQLLNTPWFMLDMTAFCPQILEKSSLKNDSKFVLEALKTNRQILMHLGDDLKQDSAFWLQILEKYVEVALFLPENFFCNKDFLIKACSYFKQSDYEKIDVSLWKDREFCLQLFKMNFRTIENYDPELWKNADFVLSILNIDSLEVDRIAKDLWKNPQFCREALKRSEEAVAKIGDHITDEQARDEEFWIPFLDLSDEGVDPRRLIQLVEKIPLDLREKEDFMVYVAGQVPGAEKFAGPQLQVRKTFQRSVKNLHKSRSQNKPIW